jgi:dTDP-4-dehydrorhamnose reductase
MEVMADLVIGANGLIGSSIMSYLDAAGTFHNKKDRLIEGRKYEYLDITDKHGVFSMFEKHRPRRVFLAAGVTSVDSCETLESDKVNVFGVSHVISNCRTFDAQLIYFSSSYAFDGKSQTPYKPSDPTSPINRYGRNKEDNERTITGREGLQYLIIRTVSVFGGSDFVSSVRKAVKENKRIRVPVDQIVNPIYAPALAKTTIHLSERYSGDIFHVAGNRCLTYYDFAIQIAYKLGCKKPHELIVGIKLEDMEQLAQRPLNACLDCKTLEARAMTVPNLEHGLNRFLES